MTYELITARNLSEGLQVPFIYVNDIMGGLFIKLLLLMVWSLVTFGLYFNQKKAIGFGDFPMAVAVAGIVTTVFTVLLKLIPGLVDTVSFAVVLIVTLLSVIWFFISRG